MTAVDSMVRQIALLSFLTQSTTFVWFHAITITEADASVYITLSSPWPSEGSSRKTAGGSGNTDVTYSTLRSLSWLSEENQRKSITEDSWFYWLLPLSSGASKQQKPGAETDRAAVIRQINHWTQWWRCCRGWVSEPSDQACVKTVGLLKI